MYKVVNGEQVEMSQEEISLIQTEWADNAIRVAKESNNRNIYQQLDAIDLKSIRAIRANDTARIAELEAQAVALRAQLVV